MPHKESQYLKDWLAIGAKDWKRMDLALDDGDAEEAGFWLQQAVEKYLKAYLLAKGWTLRKVHDLEVLLNEAMPHMPAFSRFTKACRKISAYYLAERYPFMGSPQITVDDVSRSRDEITGLVELILQELR
jgi:HEPN domain-containing protein